jgi:hypothetical protein
MTNINTFNPNYTIMFRKSILILATTFAAGLLFVNIYTSIVDATSWGSHIPESILAAKAYFQTVNPGTFFRIFSPLNQLLCLLALITCWKLGKKIRIYCAIALLIAVSTDAFTFVYFYPRNAIMFINPITDIEVVKTAWTEWATMNWLRSALVVAELVFNFAALSFILKSDK